MQAVGTPGTAALVVLALCLCARAQDATSSVSVAERFGLPRGSAISVDEARAIAEREAGMSLAEADVKTVSEGCRVPYYQFRHYGETGSSSFVISMVDGSVMRYRHARSLREAPGGAGVGADRSLSVAQAEAERLMGDLAGKLEWHAPKREGAVWECRASAPLVGDPPRDGASPFCSVAVAAGTGEIVKYSQYVPLCSEPVEVHVSSAEAEATARAAADLGDGARLETGPTLTQNSRSAGSVEWHVTLVGPGNAAPSPDGTVWGCGKHAIVMVDAVTGEVVECQVGTVEGVSTTTAVALPSPADAEPTPQPPSAAPPRATPLPLLALGAALLLAAGVGVVLLRRRR